MSEPILSIEHLTVALPKEMERQFAIKDVSFELNRGEILCIIGESGSGKSVTASAVMGLLSPAMPVTDGTIKFNDTDLLKISESARRALRGKALAMIFQDPLSALNPLMTVGAQIDEVLVAHNAGDADSRASKVRSLLEEVGLPDPDLMQHQYPFRLSGGQRQRVMIAIALALDPDVLIADEPTTALDVTTQAQILKLIRDIQRRKSMSVLFITHDFGVVEDIADRVLVMEQGALVEQGAADEVLRHPAHPYTQRLIAAVPRLRETDRVAGQQSLVVMKVEGLQKVYRTGSSFFGKQRVVHAVNDVSFTLRRGQTIGVVGESGSGKSSMGKILIKLSDADGGSVELDGIDILPLSEAEFRPLRPRIQMIFQDPFASLNPRQSIGTSLITGPLSHGMRRDATVSKARSILSQVGLDPAAFDRFPHEFSGGQRQRVGIARALMFDPEIIIADEAVSALDVSIQAQILKLLEQLQEERQLAMVFITHDLRVASQVCDEVIVMQHGKVVESGPPARLFSAPCERYTRTLVDAIPGIESRAAHSMKSQDECENRL